MQSYYEKSGVSVRANDPITGISKMVAKLAPRGISHFTMESESGSNTWIVTYNRGVWTYKHIRGNIWKEIHGLEPPSTCICRRFTKPTNTKITNRSKKSRNNPDERRLYVATDEKGNLGKSTKNERFYDVVATVVRDRSKFENVSKPYVKERGREVKYHDDPDLSKFIIPKAAPYVADVYYAKYHKDRGKHRIGLTKREKIDKHLDMLYSIADEVVRRSDYDYMDVDIDYNKLLSGEPVEQSFECSPYRDGRGICCRVEDSKTNYGLITNDFFVGVVGDYVNNPCEETQELMKFIPKPIKVHIKHNHKRRRSVYE